jgi:hypothetical protein
VQSDIPLLFPLKWMTQNVMHAIVRQVLLCFNEEFINLLIPSLVGCTSSVPFAQDIQYIFKNIILLWLKNNNHFPAINIFETV